MKSATEIKNEIIAKFGFFPPFYEPALSTPAILDNLWSQTLSAYIDNPIPNRFKEKLAALLGRYCAVPYCLLCHSSSLKPLGMKASEVLDLLEMAPIGFEELAEKVRLISDQKLDTWPEPGSPSEESILHCCVAIFLNQDTERCLESLRKLLSKEYYQYLILFIAYNKSALSWAEAHPEISYEADKRVIENLGSLINEEPKLVKFFDNYRGKVLEHTDRRTYWLTIQNKQLLDEERSLRSNLEAESKSKDIFVEALTHDLRSPLTAARLSAQMLQRRSNEPKFVEMIITKIIDNLDRTEGMIRDLLDSKLIKSGELHRVSFADIQLNEFLRSVLADLKHLHGDRFKLELSAEDIKCRWDKLAIYRAIENLASNAVKYGLDETAITISSKRTENYIEISIHNFGKHIASEDQENIFKIYNRTNEAQLSGQKGWGIGLSIVSSIIQAHNGTIEVQSDRTEGTTFTLKIPIAPV